MIKYLKELYQGISYSYHIFWDGKARAIGKTVSKRNQTHSFNIEHIGEENDLPKVLDNLGYAGEGLEVVLFGHTTVQRLEKIEVDDEGIPDWVIANKSQIFPPGIDEDELFLDYCKYDSDEGSYLGISLTKKKNLSEIQEYFKSLNLRIKTIVPLIGFALNRFGFNSIFDEDIGFPLQFPDIRFSLTKTETGYILDSSPYEASDTVDNDPNPQLPTLIKQTENSLYFHKSQDDIFSKIHSLALGWMKPVILGITIIVATSVIFNLIIMAFEVKGAEKLKEFQFLKSNFETINKQITNIEQKHGLINKLEGHRSNLAAYLNAVAAEKPEKLWWRKLEYDIDDGLTIEGFCIGDEGTAVYHKSLTKSGYFRRLELSKIEKYTVREDSRIPSKYQDEIFKFKLDIKGI